MRELTEGTVLMFYVYTAGFGPAVLGFLLGRWGPVFLRAIPLLFILPAGIYWIQNSDHFFGIYIIGNVLYTLFLVIGLIMKSHHRNVDFMDLHYFDWIIIAVSTFIMILAYQRPTA